MNFGLNKKKSMKILKITKKVMHYICEEYKLKKKTTFDMENRRLLG